MSGAPSDGSFKDAPAPDPQGAGRRLAKDSVLYTLGIAVTRFSNLLLLPLYLSQLSKADYGALAVLEQLVQVLLLLTLVGGIETQLKIGTDLRERGEQLRFASTMTTWTLLAGTVIAALCALAWPLWGAGLGGVALVPLGALALSGVAGAAAFQALSAHLQVIGKSERHTVYAALRTLLNVAIAVPLLLFADLGIKALLIATSASFWIAALALMWKVPDGLRFQLGIDGALLKRALRYGVPIMPHLAAAVIFQATDRFMLAAAEGQSLEAVGIYSVAARIASGVMMLGIGMQRAWLPYFFGEASRDDDGAWSRVRRLSYWNMAAMATAVVGLGLLAPELVRVIAPVEYAAAATVTGVLCLSTLLRTGALVTSAVVLHSTSHAHRIWLASVPAAACNVLLCALTIPKYGALGAAWSTAAAMGLNLLFTVFLARTVRRVPFRYLAVLVLILAASGLIVWGAEAPLLGRLGLCIALPLLAVALDAATARDKVRALWTRWRAP